MRRPLLRAATAGLVSVGLTLTGCGGTEPGSLMMADAEPELDFGADIPDVDSDAPVTFGFIPLCVDAQDPATITAVEFEKADNMRVSSFSVIGDTEMGTEFATLRELGFDETERQVSAACPDQGDFLGIEVRRGPDETVGTGERLVITYTRGGRTSRSTIPFYMTLCPTECE